MAEIQVDVKDEDVIALLKQNHNFSDGDAVKRGTRIEFEPRYGNSGEDHIITISLTFALSPGEVDRLIGR